MTKDHASFNDWPGLSEKERDRRWTRVREMMKSNGLECMLVFGLKGREWFDHYITNDRSGGVVIFPAEGEIVHLTWHPQDLVGHMEGTLRGEASWIDDVRVGANGTGVVEVLKEKGFDRAQIGVVGIKIWGAGEMEGYVPYTTWSFILEKLPGITFHEMSYAFVKLVSVKSEEELALVRRAAAIGEVAAATMLEVTRPGIGENEIYAAVMNQLYLNGAMGNASPYVSPMILHSGPDNPSWGAPMWLFRGQKPRTVQKGDLVQAEIFPRYGGMEAQLQMSIAISPVDPVNRKCAEISRQSYEAGLQSLRPGKKFGEVVEAMEKPLKKAGAWYLTPLIHSQIPLTWCSGMGVGIENLPGFVERYKWSGNRPILGADQVIEANTLWEFEPNVCFGRHRVNIGGIVLVTERGAQSLNTLPTEMRVVE
jgi:Xaa-Pro aminopeptidase